MDTEAIMREMQASFRIEADELILDLEETLLELETRGDDKELIDRAFRSMHTLKGSGSSAGFGKLATFLHKFEDAFNLAREGAISVTPELVEISFQSVDRIKEMMQEDPGSDFDKEAVEQDPILVDLSALLPHGNASGGGKRTQDEGADAKSIGIYTILFSPYAEFMNFGNDPISVIDEIRTLGHATINGSAKIPELKELNPENCYLSWTIELVSEAPQSDVEEIFSFVEMDADIEITRQEKEQDLTSNHDGLFELSILDDFESESSLLLRRLRDCVASLENESMSSENWEMMHRSFHSFKGNAGILTSCATQSLPSDHVLNQITSLAYAGEQYTEDLVSSDKPAVSAEGAQRLVELVSHIEERVKAFSLRYKVDPPASELIAFFELEGESALAVETAEAPPAEPEPAKTKSVFEQVTAQTVIMLKSCIGGFQDEARASGNVAIFKRGLTNLSNAAGASKAEDLVTKIQGISSQLDLAAKSNPASLEDLATGAIKKIEEGIQAFVDEQAAQQAAKEASSKPAASSSPSDDKAAPKSANTLRVDEDKIDRLMRAIGELLVARGAFPMMAKTIADDHGLGAIAQDLREAGGNVSRLADELQSAVMSIRMSPLQTVFQRYPRMIRDLAKSLGKKVTFEISGEDTELDKSVLEQLGDPLVHILRNAVDHGIETPEEREAAGKSPEGRIHMRAATEGTTVSIKIVDNGKGLDPEKLKRKAIEKGLITQAEADQLDRKSALELIMKPGFSTAAQITDVSGRGVGMDVVANNIRKLQGTIEIDSETGNGSTFNLRLPTSLLISEAILIKCGQEEYLIPMENIASLEKIERSRVRGHVGSQMVTIRDEVISLIDLRELLDIEVDEDSPQEEILSVALLQTTEGVLGIAVDKFVSQEEIVIKPLSGELADVKLFSGASIMGDGRVVPVFNALEIQNFYAKVSRQLAEATLAR